MTEPSISVIIPTRGRDECLRQTLRDLAAQKYINFDIWVVDQNDKPLQNLESEASGISFHHEVMSPLGSHAGRNHAIFKTSAEICVFVDDDVRVPEAFLAAHAEAFVKAPKNIGSIAGRVIQPRDGYSEEQMRQMGRPARYSKWTGLVSGNFVGLQSAPVEHIHECNFSARTSVLRAIGGFNEEFKGNAYFEGADLALRIIDAGYGVLYCPEIVLTHLQEGAGGNRLHEKSRHTYWFMRNYGLLNSLHMKAIGLPVFSAFSLAYVLGKAAKNADPEIAKEGLRGFVDGLRYFQPNKVKLRTRKT